MSLIEKIITLCKFFDFDFLRSYMSVKYQYIGRIFSKTIVIWIENIKIRSLEKVFRSVKKYKEVQNKQY